MSKVEHPMQPLVWDGEVIRFKENKIVQFLVEFGRLRGMSLNELHLIPFSQNDWEQFNQLIGYSVSGYGDLSFHRKSVVTKADLLASEMRHKRFSDRVGEPEGAPRLEDIDIGTEREVERLEAALRYVGANCEDPETVRDLVSRTLRGKSLP